MIPVGRFFSDPIILFFVLLCTSVFFLHYMYITYGNLWLCSLLVAHETLNIVGKKSALHPKITLQLEISQTQELSRHEDAYNSSQVKFRDEI